MKIVSSNGRYMVYSDDLKTYDKIPAGTYNVSFSKMSGFSLSERPNVDEVSEKIYGNYLSKIDKTMKSFELSKKNFGIMLSGEKGMGKSMFSRVVSLEAIKRGMPVIIVDSYIPGISNFISSIDQEVMVMFDEFEKTFKMDNENSNFDPQEDLLTLLDGFDNGKKLFVMTCNSIYKINDFLINRPGRIHYHFRFSYPTIEEIREYLKDKISEDLYKKEIPDIISFASKVDISYDILKAIAFEINNGYSFKESVADLNMINDNEVLYDILVEFSDGIISDTTQEIDLFRDKFEIRGLSRPGEDRYLNVIIEKPEIVCNNGNIEIVSGFSSGKYSVKKITLNRRKHKTFKYTV